MEHHTTSLFIPGYLVHYESQLQYDCGSNNLIFIDNVSIHKKERGASSCRSFHILKAFALPCSSKRATRISPTRCIYTTSLIDVWTHFVHIANEEYIGYTFKGRSRCFVFDEQMNLRSSQNVKTKASRKRLYYVFSFFTPLSLTA